MREVLNKVSPEMVFFYQNCSDLLWEKIVLEQFIRTVKGEHNFWNKMRFLLVLGGFSDLIHYLEKFKFKMETNNWDLETTGKVRNYGFYNGFVVNTL